MSGQGIATVPSAPGNVIRICGQRAGDHPLDRSRVGRRVAGSGSYTVTASNGMTVSTTGATSATMTGLTNGTSYTFTVKAHNALGASPASRRRRRSLPEPGEGGGGGQTRLGQRAGRRTWIRTRPIRATHTFQVQKRSSAGTWSTVGSYRTEGTGETKSVSLAAGTYRVVVPASGAYGGATSPAVTLTNGKPFAPDLGVGLGLQQVGNRPLGQAREPTVASPSMATSCSTAIPPRPPSGPMRRVSVCPATPCRTPRRACRTTSSTSSESSLTTPRDTALHRPPSQPFPVTVPAPRAP